MLHWEKYPNRTAPDGRNMVTLEDTVYLYKRYRLFSAPLPFTNHTSWSELSRPPVYDSYLATYQSQLVLVGGSNVKSKYTNTLWVSADGHSWHQSLPPMSRCCRWPTVLSSTSPECLIVHCKNRCVVLTCIHVSFVCLTE